MAVSLLNELLNNTLDQGYAEAAQRRAERGQPPARWRGRLVVAAGLLLIGLVGGVGFAQARRSAPESGRVKIALIRDIESRTASSDDLESQLDRLAAQVARDRDAALAASHEGASVRTALRRLEDENGLLAVRGPGLEVTVGDAPPTRATDPVTGQQQTIQPDENGRITDRDLQIVVNALWAAGAEAVAVDGRRLTATTTIREAGGAILVDFFAVTSPYAIEAIGDPDRMLPRFVDSRIGQQYQTYVGAYQIQFDVRRQDRINLRAATGLDVQYAAVPVAPSPSRGPNLQSGPAPAGGPTAPPSSTASARSGITDGLHMPGGGT
jgi:uncharacterized protein YlxW (UPF0749 family)